MAETRWMLAFDAACGTCRVVSATVATACDGRLEVVPLGRDDVRQWRTEALGPQAPWAPTLISVTGEHARAWTGPVMGVRLARRLGVRSGLRVLAALGGLRRAETASGEQTGKGSGKGFSRKQFLRVGAGAGLAVGILAGGAMPAFAATNNITEWAKANPGRLPRTYGELLEYPTEFRRAVWGQLSPEFRGSVWRTEFANYRAAHPELTSAQQDVLRRATALAANPALFAHPLRDAAADQDLARQVDALAAAATTAFGKQEASRVFANLGPDTATRALPAGVAAGVNGCTCSSQSVNSCSDGNCVSTDLCNCRSNCAWCGIPCAAYKPGCGLFYQFECDGGCGDCAGARC